MHWLEADIHHLLLPTTSLLFLISAIYRGMRKRAGLSEEDTPTAKVIYLLAFGVIFVLAIFYRYR
jgi:hypothetical protein